MKEKRPLNPAEAYRRSQKKKVLKQKQEVRKERLKRVPVEKRDPYKLISEIQKYNILEYEGKLTGDGRMHKKRLVDQFNSLRKARINSGLEAIEVPVFDSETYEANKAKIKTGGSYGAILKRMADDLKKSQRQDEVYDPETELPRLPEGEPPFPDGIPGLPPYNIMEFEEQEGDEEESKLVLIAQQTKEVEFEQQKDQAATRIVFESQPQLSGKFKRRKQKDKLDEEVEDFLRLLE